MPFTVRCRSRGAAFGLLTALAATLGCHDITGPARQRADLEAARSKWRSKGYTTYQFTLTMDCFCAVDGPMRVVVLRDTVRSVTLIASGQAVSPQYIPSINALFDVIDADIARPAAVLEVTYDDALGYPAKIISDPIANAVDDEVNYFVSDVIPVGLGDTAYGTAPAAPARRGSAPAVTRPLSIRSAAP